MLIHITVRRSDAYRDSVSVCLPLLLFKDLDFYFKRNVSGRIKMLELVNVRNWRFSPQTAIFSNMSLYWPDLVL